jgi:hypothetical protein
MGGEACALSGRQRPGQAAAVGKVLGDVAGARPGHPTEPAGIVYDLTSDQLPLDEVERVVFFVPLLREGLLGGFY